MKIISIRADRDFGGVVEADSLRRTLLKAAQEWATLRKSRSGIEFYTCYPELIEKAEKLEADEFNTIMEDLERAEGTVCY